MAQNIYTPQGKMRQGVGTLRPSPSAPPVAPGGVDLAALARNLPLQGRGLPMMQGGLGPDRNMLIRQALLNQIRGGQ